MRSFGAVGDGVAVDTPAIQRAIDACAATGGGRVVFGPGRFLSGSLVLKDGVRLWLGPSTTLLGSSRIEDYPTGHLIAADGASHVGIEGYGTIDGQGSAFWDAEDRPRPRPEPWIELRRCRDVHIRGVRFQNSPSQTISLTRCRRVRVDDISIETAYHGPNTDGIDVSGSAEVFIRGASIATGDDAICLKAREQDMVVENVVVSSCMLASDDSALKLGTGSGGVIRHVVFSNNVIRGTRYGIALFMKDGGVFHNIRFSDTSIETGTRRERPRYEIPIFIDIERRTPGVPLGWIRDVVFTGLDITTRGSLLIAGQPGRPIENLSLSGITVRVREPLDMAGQQKPRGTRSLTEPARNDYSRVPATVVLAHQAGLRLRDVRVLAADAPAGSVARRALWAADLVDAVIDGFDGAPVGASAELPALELADGRGILVRGSRAAAGTRTWLQVSGPLSSGIRLLANETSAARVALRVGAEVEPGAVSEAERTPARRR